MQNNSESQNNIWRNVEFRPRRDGALGRQIKGDQPGVDDPAQDRPAQLADGKNPHFLFCKTPRFHRDSQPSSLNFQENRAPEYGIHYMDF